MSRAEGPLITRNVVRCRLCSQSIESRWRNNYVTCRCGAAAIEGGRDKLVRIGNINNMEDLSEFRPHNGPLTAKGKRQAL